MNNQQWLQRFQQNAPSFLTDMGGQFIAVESSTGRCELEFNVGANFCHSVDTVQGGFVTAMLDVAMTHAVFATNENIINLASLEIKTSYLEPVKAGRLLVEGYVIKCTHKTAFMEGRIQNPEGLLLATASTVAKLWRS
ncbi:MAG: PaaI family thioesterase [Pseudomonadota bacterium]